MSELKVELPDPKPDEVTAPVDAVIDQAKDIGAALARLDAIEAAHETLKSAHDDLVGTVNGLGDRVGDVAELAGRAASVPVDLSDQIAREVAEQLEAAKEDVAPVVDEVPPAPRIENVAKQEPGGWRGFIRRLNLH